APYGDDHAIIAAGRINIEDRRAVADRASRSALARRIDEELLPVVLARAEIRERRGIADRGAPGVVFRVKGLNAAQKLGDSHLNRLFVNERRAERELKED